MESIEVLRRQIKAWEHGFAKEQGRAPSKDDIRKDKTTKELYKQYRRLKMANNTPPAPISPKQDKSFNDPQTTPSRRYQSTQSDPQSTPTKNLPFNSIGSIELGELGPTPQANGKVLLIFDVQTSVTPPETLNSKGKPSYVPPVFDSSVLGPSGPPGPSSHPGQSHELLPFKTPTKPSRIALVHASPSQKPSLLLKLTQASSLSEIAATPAIIRQSLFLTSQLNHGSPTTPTKGGKLFETPGKGFQVSPSPLKLHRFLSFGESKKMVNLFKDYESIQREDLQYELGTDSQTVATEEAKENEADMTETVPGFKRKAKTQKRTTRNWHIKPRLEVEQDVMQGKTVQEVMRNLEQKEEVSEEDSEIDSDEELQQQRDAALNAKEQEKGKRKPLSVNYKRYKINDPRTKAFKRRMRR